EVTNSAVLGRSKDNTGCARRGPWRALRRASLPIVAQPAGGRPGAPIEAVVATSVPVFTSYVKAKVTSAVRAPAVAAAPRAENGKVTCTRSLAANRRVRSA